MTNARSLFARNALLDTGWATNVSVSWDIDGYIDTIAPDSNAGSDQAIVDILIPGMANLHCHAFQRAMSGLAEVNSGKRDDFWSWRDLMYRFVQHITPEDMQAIAAFAYMEMLESGFTSVGEFHYLHHQRDGTPYDNPVEMADRVMQSARAVGIGMTLLPVFYAHSDFGGTAPVALQNRFVHDLDGYQDLLQICQQQNPDMTTGMAAHSLRAVTPDGLRELVNTQNSGPIHIHVAEQIAEVKACQNALGARPVRWLLDQFDINDRWCLIHATHMDETETRDLARSGAIAGLCPMTEANLGDGIFNGVSYFEAGGHFGIGSDSCVRIDLAEEIRWLEYSQRMRDQKRLRLAPTGKSVGGHLYRQCAKGSAQALGQAGGEISLGQLANFIALDADHPALAGRSKDALLDGWIFGSGQNVLQDVWVKGVRVVTQSHHVKYEVITNAYLNTLQKLLTRVYA